MRTYGAFLTGYKEGDDVFEKELPAIPEEYQLANTPPVMNQGSSPICCAMSIAEIIYWQDMIKNAENKADILDPHDIYKLREDKTMQGMIPRDALEKMRDIGVDGKKIGRFAFVRNRALAQAAILMNGPIMLCTAAYSGDQFWKPGGESLGGHAVILTGWDKEGFTLQNSWGYQYASGGTIKFPFQDWKYMTECWTIEI